jgi:aerobic-type carbon monoxide dehydrogenase small subunit (CoxS/CutS family)
VATITVNGKPHTVQATPDTPLLYVLRNEVELNGPKYGCGLAQCGSLERLKAAGQAA